MMTELNLKNAYRYQKFLNDIAIELCFYLHSMAFVTTTTETHNRSAVYENGKDETFVRPVDGKSNATPEQVVSLTMEIIDERDNLMNAIANAKRVFAPTMDGDIASNRLRHELISSLRYMAGIKDKTEVSEKNAYKFNETGEQVVYRYEVEKETKADFDRTFVKNSLNKLTEVADELSNKSDIAMSSLTVDFTPKFNMNDSAMEIVEAYIKA